MPELSVGEQSRLRTMIGSRTHPDQIENYLTERGYSKTDIDKLYADANIRRYHLFDCYRMKRNVKLVGCLLVFIAVAMSLFVQGSNSLVISLGLLAYGAAMVITGSLTVYRP